MAETESSIFNRRATERLRSPDDLDRYVRVTRPSVWAILAACVLLIGGLIVWGSFGTVNMSVNSTGVRVGDKVCCFVPKEEALRVRIGDASLVDDARLKVVAIGSNPLSFDEVRTEVGSDYLAQALMGDNKWVFEIDFGDADDSRSEVHESVPLQVGITTEKVTPFQIVFGSGA